MSKSARRKDFEQRSIELDLKMEVMLLKEQLMELQEDYDDLWNAACRMYESYCSDVGQGGVDPYGKELQRFKSDRIT